MKIPLAFTLSLLLSGCATHRMGRFINLETGEEVRVEAAYEGTGSLRDGDWILDFRYLRPGESTSAVGTATDNRGVRYKVVFWTARKPKAAVAGK